MQHILTLTCDDRPGLVHAVCGGLLDVGGNIVENAQFTDPDTNTFCMRTAAQHVRPAYHRPRILIMVSS